MARPGEERDRNHHELERNEGIPGTPRMRETFGHEIVDKPAQWLDIGVAGRASEPQRMDHPREVCRV